jgi:hypothetical protein
MLTRVVVADDDQHRLSAQALVAWPARTGDQDGAGSASKRVASASALSEPCE